MKIGRLTLSSLLVLLAAGAQAVQTEVAPERELDDIIAKSTAAGAMGDTLTAINLMENALQKVQKNPR